MGGLSSSAGVNIGDTIGGGTQGSVLFLGVAGALAERNAKLFWDDTNFRLGIGNAAPTASLNVSGTIQATNKDAVVSGNGSLELYFSSNRGQLLAFDRTANANRALVINGDGGTRGNVFIGGDTQGTVLYTNRSIYIDGRNNLSFTSGILMEGPVSSVFSFDQNGIAWYTAGNMMQWTNNGAGRAGQVWRFSEVAAGAGLDFYNNVSGNIAIRINSNAATGVMASLQIGTKFYAPQDTGALQTSCGIYAGLGVPNNANGVNGDFYFRSDGAVGSNVYKKGGGVWAAIL